MVLLFSCRITPFYSCTFCILSAKFSTRNQFPASHLKLPENIWCNLSYLINPILPSFSTWKPDSDAGWNTKGKDRIQKTDQETSSSSHPTWSYLSFVFCGVFLSFWNGFYRISSTCIEIIKYVKSDWIWHIQCQLLRLMLNITSS